MPYLTGKATENLVFRHYTRGSSPIGHGQINNISFCYPTPILCLRSLHAPSKDSPHKIIGVEFPVCVFLDMAMGRLCYSSSHCLSS